MTYFFCKLKIHPLKKNPKILYSHLLHFYVLEVQGIFNVSDFVFLMTKWFIHKESICWKKYTRSDHFIMLTRKCLPSTMRELSFKNLSVINVLHIIDIAWSQDWDQSLFAELTFAQKPLKTMLHCLSSLDKLFPWPTQLWNVFSYN